MLPLDERTKTRPLRRSYVPYPHPRVNTSTSHQVRIVIVPVNIRDGSVMLVQDVLNCRLSR